MIPRAHRGRPGIAENRQIIALALVAWCGLVLILAVIFGAFG